MTREEILETYLTEKELSELDGLESDLDNISDQLDAEKVGKKKQKLRQLYNETLNRIFDLEGIAGIRYEDKLADEPEKMLKEALGTINNAKKEDFDQWKAGRKFKGANAEKLEEQNTPFTYFGAFILPHHINAAYILKHTEGSAFYYDEIEKAVTKRAEKWGFKPITTTADGSLHIVGARVTRHHLIKDHELSLVFDIFNEAMNDRRQINGQITMLPVKADYTKPITTRTGRKSTEINQVTSYYSINFAETLPQDISRRLTPTDRLLYGAMYSNQCATGPIMTIRQLGRTMGYKGDLNDDQTAEIWKNLQKMQGAFIWYDFHEEREIYKGSEGYENIGIEGKAGEPLLTFRALKGVTINGVPTDDAIEIIGDLPLYRLAERRGNRVADLPIECLQLPGKMQRTDKNLSMVFYVLEMLEAIKKPRKDQAYTIKNKILYNTLYEKCGINTDKTGTGRKARADFKKKLFLYLDHLKEINYIKAYKEETTESTGEVGIKFYFEKDTTAGGTP